MALRNIIVGTDFSQASLEAVRVGGRLAEQTGAAVTLVHVLDRIPTVPSAAPIGMAASVDLAAVSAVEDDRLRQQAERSLAECRRDDLGQVAEVHTRLVLHASAAAALLDLSDADDVDLVVVASHGRTGLDRLLLGSVAERLVRHGSCPVLVVRNVGAVESFPQRIAAATDFSVDSMAGVDLAAAWASSFERPLSVVHVYDTTPYLPDAAVSAEAESLDAVQAPLRQALEELHQERLGGRVDVTMRLLAAESVAGGLCSYAEESELDLIVLSTLGRTGLKRLVLGTVAEKVVRHAPCSVLTTPSRG